MSSVPNEAKAVDIGVSKEEIVDEDSCSVRLAGCQAFVLKNFLPLGFATAFIVGLSFPAPGKELGGVKVEGWSFFSSLLVCVIFIISGVTLSTSQIREAIGAWRGGLLGLVSILIITPFFGLVPMEIPFEPQEFKVGLAVFCMMPTTLSSGVALVTQAKGNSALALMLTVLSNLLAIITIPFMATLVLSVSDVSIDPLPLLAKLLCTILVPLIIGKCLQEASEAVRLFVKAHKVALGLVNNGSLILISWMKLSLSADKFKDIAVQHIFLAVLAGVVIHCVFLALNLGLLSIPAFELDLKEYRAVMIMASQKTLPVAVTVIGFLPDSAGEQGLMVIPCIISHMSQIFMDAYIVSVWVADSEQAEKEPLSPELKPHSNTQEEELAVSDVVTVELDSATEEDSGETMKA